MNVSHKRAVDHDPIEQNGVEVDLITIGQNLVEVLAVELNTECQFRIRSKYCRHRSCRTNSYLCRTYSKRSCRPKSVEHPMRPLSTTLLVQLRARSPIVTRAATNLSSQVESLSSRATRECSVFIVRLLMSAGLPERL